jgi:hypothetical protein
MTDPAPDTPGTAQQPAWIAPTISATAGYVITGAGFLPDHEVTVRITYTADDISDYLTYTTNSHGELYAELPISAATGTLHITVTDHRTDPDGVCRRLWSNTGIVHARNA